jgi:carboxypeptidase C (cathepsin A)
MFIKSRPAALSAFSLVFLLFSPAFAQFPAHGEARPQQQPPAGKGDKEAGPTDRLVTTFGEVSVGGKVLHYKATAGTLVLKDDAGKAKAEVFFVAYEKHDKPAHPATRPAESRPSDAKEADDRESADAEDSKEHASDHPLTFFFNGGPGAAAVWLHLGAAGPRRVKLTEDGHPLPPPGALEDNPDCWLDATDMVFIDPVGTGFSRPVAGESQEQFSGVQEDVHWVADFIRLYTTRNNRWLSPKFLAGESYGTTRAAALSEHLLEQQGIALNGIVFISTVLDFQTLSPSRDNGLPYALYLPTYTATAAYHKKLAPDLAADLPKTLKEVEQWAMGDYLVALAKGDSLDARQRAAIVQKLAAYTGLKAETIDRADLRIDPDLFRQKLLEDSHQVIGRFDARLTGYDADTLSRDPQYDPSFNAFYAAYGSAFNDYVRRTLKYDSDTPYEVLTGRVGPWNFGHSGQGFLNVAVDLERAMQENEHLKVLFAAGQMDLATPYMAMNYTVDHLDLSPELRKNIEQAYFPSGHMVYHPRPSAHKLHEDVRAFIEAATPKEER